MPKPRSMIIPPEMYDELTRLKNERGLKSLHKALVLYFRMHPQSTEGSGEGPQESAPEGTSPQDLGPEGEHVRTPPPAGEYRTMISYSERELSESSEQDVRFQIAQRGRAPLDLLKRHRLEESLAMAPGVGPAKVKWILYRWDSSEQVRYNAQALYDVMISEVAILHPIAWSVVQDVWSLEQKHADCLARWGGPLPSMAPQAFYPGPGQPWPQQFWPSPQDQSFRQLDEDSRRYWFWREMQRLYGPPPQQPQPQEQSPPAGESSPPREESYTIVEPLRDADGEIMRDPNGNAITRKIRGPLRVLQKGFM